MAPAPPVTFAVPVTLTLTFAPERTQLLLGLRDQLLTRLLFIGLGSGVVLAPDTLETPVGTKRFDHLAQRPAPLIEDEPFDVGKGVRGVAVTKTAGNKRAAGATRRRRTTRSCSRA